ncbi:hypothetical protein ACPUD2_02530 [Leuconostoc mesenteroides subsp. dextranicum]|uniref:hypothetical protein n=1 Tax=Leuconostoc mesenteroides TaxID=1245 RepID=UPI003C9B2C76
MEFVGHHVTPETNVKSILNDFRNGQTPIKTGAGYLNQQIYLATLAGNRAKRPGSLGYGIYTFVDGIIDPTVLCKNFSGRQMKNISVKEVVFYIEIKEENLIDLTNSQSTQYQIFVNFCRAINKIITQTHHKFEKNGENQFVWEGIAMELFVQHMEKHCSAVTYGVLRDTYTPCDDGDVPASERITSNGNEFLIRNWEIVRKIDHYVLK